jgi:hypothetical protein
MSGAVTYSYAFKKPGDGKLWWIEVPTTAIENPSNVDWEREMQAYKLALKKAGEPNKNGGYRYYIGAAVKKVI